MQSLRHYGVKQRTLLPEDAFAMSLFLLPWLLTVQMHLQILMNHTKIHTQTATPQREIVLSYPQML